MLLVRRREGIQDYELSWWRFFAKLMCH